MLTSKKLELRRSEIMQSLAELAANDTPTPDETRKMGELDLEYRTAETRYRAALISENTESREAGAELETRSDREWADLMQDFEMRQVALCLDEGRALDGKTAEIVNELRGNGGGADGYEDDQHRLGRNRIPCHHVLRGSGLSGNRNRGRRRSDRLRHDRPAFEA